MSSPLLLMLLSSPLHAATLADLSVGDLVITEIMASPTQVGYSRGQWFEVHNASGLEVDLSGLQVSNASGVAFTVSGTLTAPAGAYVLFAVRSDTTLNGGLPAVDYVYSLSALTLNGKTGTLALGYSGTTFDTVTYNTTAGYPEAIGSSFSLDPLALTAAGNDSAANWCESEGSYGDGDYGSPGEANDACPVSLSALAAGDLVLTEVMTNPSAVPYYRGEWLEITNVSTAYVDLDGLEVSDSGSDIFVIGDPIALRPGESVALAVRDNPLVNGGIEDVGYRYIWRTEMNLRETDDVILAYGSTLFDEVSWNAVDFPATLGVSKNLNSDLFTETDNDSGANWCDATAAYGDGDYGTPGTANSDCDADTDGDGYTEDVDCDDEDAATNPGAAEVCNDADDDCDDSIDEDAADATSYYADADNDYYGDAAITQDACERPSFYRTNDLDCDDTDANIGKPTTRYADSDSDGYGALLGAEVCADVSGYIDDSSDCDDSTSDVFPGAPETCNDGIDSDCDGVDSNDCQQDLAAAAVTIWGAAAGDRLGRSLAGGGDLDGDGVDDLALGSHPSDLAGTDAGAVFLVYGPLTSDRILTEGDTTLTGEAAGDQAGIILATDGDLDGDGFDDLLVGAQANDDGATDAGAAYIVYGPVTSDRSLSAADVDLTGEASNDLAGVSLDIVGDVDNDGVDDFIVGAQERDIDSGSNRGAAYLFYGPATSGSLSTADAIFQGATAQDYAGYSLSGAGDFDGDGSLDLWINAYRADPISFNEGSNYLVSGPVTGTVDLSAVTTRLHGEASSDQAGQYAIANAGDVNNDGVSDVVVGAQYHDVSGVSDAGAAYLVYGPVSGSVSLSGADAKFTGANTQDFAGRSVEGAGDVNADGFADVLIGAKKDDRGGTDAGAAYLVLGPVSGTQALTSADAIFDGAAGEEVGIGVAAAGDVNADGSPDLLIGAYFNDDNGVDAGAAYLLLGGGY